MVQSWRYKVEKTAFGRKKESQEKLVQGNYRVMAV